MRYYFTRTSLALPILYDTTTNIVCGSTGVNQLFVSPTFYINITCSGQSYDGYLTLSRPSSLDPHVPANATILNSFQFRPSDYGIFSVILAYTLTSSDPLQNLNTSQLITLVNSNTYSYTNCGFFINIFSVILTEFKGVWARRSSCRVRATMEVSASYPVRDHSHCMALLRTTWRSAHCLSLRIQGPPLHCRQKHPSSCRQPRARPRPS